MSNYHEGEGDDIRWQAVISRCDKADGQFVFAVKTTGIYCRPSCRARRPHRENVCFFASNTLAEQAGFRPCKRCQPDKASRDAQRIERITQACRIIEQADTPPTLNTLAEQVAMSPYHFHRLFKRVTGLTPKAWATAVRAKRLREELALGRSVTQAACDAGFSSSSGLYQPSNTLGMTPSRFCQGGKNMTIHFAVGTCSLGLILVAQSERGICAILLGDDAAQLEQELKFTFPQAMVQRSEPGFISHLQSVIRMVDAPAYQEALPLDIQGTVFQQRVWQVLRTIASGETLSYQDVAHRIGSPKAVRAVAGACAANKLAVIIPCHRVVRHDGKLSGYRWGVERKRQLLDAEKKAQEE